MHGIEYLQCDQDLKINPWPKFKLYIQTLLVSLVSLVSLVCLFEFFLSQVPLKTACNFKSGCGGRRLPVSARIFQPKENELRSGICGNSEGDWTCLFESREKLVLKYHEQ